MNTHSNNSPVSLMPEKENIDFTALLESVRNKKTELICVLGPTASGKTKYAVRLAREFDRLCGKQTAEIISADSRQIYKGMDIGTGKDLEEYGEIPLHLTDIAEAGEKYNVYEYQQAFEEVYGEIMERGGIPIICGGSGLYISAAVNAYSFAEVPPDPELRCELEKEDIEELREKLAELKPITDRSVFESRKRLVRALEIAFYEEDHNITKSSFKKKDTYFIGMLVSAEERNKRIDDRLEYRLNHGLVEEVDKLLKDGIPPETLSYYGLEYRFVSQYILKIYDYDEMKRMLGDAIHRFGKRQMTWFRNMEKTGIRIHWTEP
ncbi:MAG: tRNA (adenosine(37)-N6)-dimethylallyltransferase MiaA [Bacteroidales bacterium]|nr:tRNA (adenosine(37)-N6)-dimethylallyltransferase MiaA [Bacteroidales bacterium]MCI1784678.1 tRNA (adenosine(37)-N6)-dimethylallyltransferase MiaA [Bacteroidales bacterium]